MIKSAKFDDFYNCYESDIRSYTGVDKATFHNRVRSLQGYLAENLSEIGLGENSDYNVGWDCSSRYFLYVAILDSRHISSRIVDCVMRAFSKDDEPMDWVCHFHIEDPNSPIGNQFYIKGNGDILIEDEDGWEAIQTRLMV